MCKPKQIGVMTLFAALSLARAALGQAVIRHVSTNVSELASQPPYNTWTNAARTIQAAIDAAVAANGDWVWVTNGVYDSGGDRAYDSPYWLGTNRVSIYKPILVQSVNGPSNTFIAGKWHVPGDVNNIFGPASIRCAYLTNGASLVGFTLTGGAAPSSRSYGGGAYILEGATISNCTIAANMASQCGGGLFGRGVLHNCFLTGNTAVGYNAGGAYYPTFYNCTIAFNVASGESGGGNGGGVWQCVLYDCELTANTAVYTGGGAHQCALYNCTVAGNSCDNYAGGIMFASAANCIVYHNQAPISINWRGEVLSYTCTTPLPTGANDGGGNIEADPIFVNPGGGYGANHVPGDYRLRASFRTDNASPCFNKGLYHGWMAPGDAHGRDRDLDGGARIRHHAVDMGAYEARISRGSLFSAE